MIFEIQMKNPRSGEMERYISEDTDLRGLFQSLELFEAAGFVSIVAVSRDRTDLCGHRM